MLNLLQEVVVAEASNVANLARLTNIMEGVDGAATFGYSVEETAIQIDDNQTQNVYFDHSFDIRVLDRSAESAKLFEFVENQTPVIMSGYSPDGFFLWTIPTKLVVQRQFDEITAIAVKATQRTPPNYFGEAPDVNKGIYAGGNAFALFDVLRGSSRMNGMLFDTIDTSLAFTFAAGIQNIIRASEGGTFANFTDVFFPFPNKTATLTVFFNEVFGDSGQMRIQAIGSDKKNTLETVTGSLEVAFNIEITRNITLPQDTFYLRFSIKPGDTTASFVEFSKPRLRLDGRTEFSL